MLRQFKASALLTFVLAALFYLFFQVSKHNPALAQINPFAEDPYDSVGSFGIQLALFTALLSLLRAFRPYQPNKILDRQEQLLLQATYLSCLSIALTLSADIVAMLRHPTMWIGIPAGYLLATLVGGMALLTALVGWLIQRSMRTLRPPSPQNTWMRAISISIVSILVLIFYPENWRQSIHGELLTISVGILYLFAPLWALRSTNFPYPETFFEDSMDDLTSIYRWLKAHTGPFAVVYGLLEKILDWPFVRLVLNWLNPRKHTWNLAILLGIVVGIALTLTETLVEGGGSPQIGRLALLATVFISFECAGVLLGYALFAKPLGLFRKTADDNARSVRISHTL
jgi:hypothetical protein